MTTGEYTYDVTLTVCGGHADNIQSAEDKVTEALRGVASDCVSIEAERIEDDN